MKNLIKETWFKCSWSLLLISLLWGYTQSIFYVALVTTDKLQTPNPSQVKNHFEIKKQPLLKSMLEGSMSEYLDSDEDRQAFYIWMKNGAQQPEYNNKVKEIVNFSCIECHQPGEKAEFANFENFEVIQSTAIYSYLPHLKKILRKSHPHALSISLLILPFILSLQLWPISSHSKIVLSCTPYIGLILDISGWFLMLVHPSSFWLILFGGGLTTSLIYILGFGSLYHIWWVQNEKS
ncbi:MAG: hypothetical protein KC471_01330 [Flavobacteriaceae bacterium]|nr:hypothetical protein [Flavobacteriaceae bacterium]